VHIRGVRRLHRQAGRRWSPSPWIAQKKEGMRLIEDPSVSRSVD